MEQAQEAAGGGGIAARFHLDRLPVALRDLPFTERMSLHGRTAVVTGGGGAGLGQACCHRLAELGADVVVFDRDGDRAQLVASQVAERHGVATVAVAGSVVDWDDVVELMTTTAARFGHLDVLVNSAGGLVGRQFGPFVERTRAHIDDLVALNLTATMYATHAALHVMLDQRSGVIVNVASEGGRVGMKHVAIYNACKAGVIGFTRNVAHEVGDAGVRVVGVAPGVMMTDGMIAMLERAPGTVATIAEGFDRTTLGRGALPEEVADVIAFLCTDSAGFVHGTTVSVGGGMAD